MTFIILSLLFFLSPLTDLCADVHCKFGAQCENGTCVCPTECPPNKEPVCGSNLMTYANECELQKTACRLGRQLTVHFYGDCTEGLNPPATIGLYLHFFFDHLIHLDFLLHT